MAHEDEILIPLLQSECQISDIKGSQFPDICTISLQSSDFKLTTDLNTKYFPILDSFKYNKDKSISIEALLFKGPGELLDPQFNYIMLGNVYEIKQENHHKLFKVSFGGMLMELRANVQLADMDEVGLGMKIIVS